MQKEKLLCILAIMCLVSTGCKGKQEFRSINETSGESIAESTASKENEIHRGISINTDTRRSDILIETIPDETKYPRSHTENQDLDESSTGLADIEVDVIEDHFENENDETVETEDSDEDNIVERLNGNTVTYKSTDPEMTGPFLTEPQMLIPDGFSKILWYADNSHTVEIQFPYIITDEMLKSGVELFPVYVK